MARRLFEQSANNNPSTSQRIAFGRAGNPTENMTIGNFLSYLLTNLAFLRRSNNLSDLTNGDTARSNLGVYSTSQVDTRLAAKTDIYPTSGGALRTTNTSSYTPSADYHPATKKYVDDNANDLLLKGSYSVGDVSGGVDKRTITFTSVGTSNYMVVGNLVDLNTTTRVQDIIWGTTQHLAASFQLCMKETTSTVQNLIFYYRLYPL